MVSSIEEWNTICENNGIEIKPLVKPETIDKEQKQAEPEHVHKEQKQAEQYNDSIPDIRIRDYPEFMIGEVSIRISDDQIKYKKPIMTRMGMLRTQENARKEMNKMGGKILESYTEKTRRNSQKELANAVRDISSGVEPAELKKKYDAETIKNAKDTIKIAKSMK